MGRVERYSFQSRTAAPRVRKPGEINQNKCRKISANYLDVWHTDARSSRHHTTQLGRSKVNIETKVNLISIYYYLGIT